MSQTPNTRRSKRPKSKVTLLDGTTRRSYAAVTTPNPPAQRPPSSDSSLSPPQPTTLLYDRLRLSIATADNNNNNERNSNDHGDDDDPSSSEDNNNNNRNGNDDPSSGDNDDPSSGNDDDDSDSSTMAPSTLTLDANAIKFLEICNLGDTIKDPIPLVLQQASLLTLGDIYGLSDDQVWDFLKSYDDGNGPIPMPKFLLSKLINAILWIKYKLAGETADAVQSLDADEFRTWLHQLSVGRIDRIAIHNAIGTANLVNGTSTSTLSPDKLLDNWNRNKRTYSSTLDAFKENHQFPTFQRELTLDLRDARCLRIIDPTFDRKTLAAGDDKELWDLQLTYVDIIFRNKLKTMIAKTVYDNPLLDHRPDLVWDRLLISYEQSELATSNATLIADAIATIRSRQFPTRMEFLNKFQALMNTYNALAAHNMTDTSMMEKLEQGSSDDVEFRSAARLEKRIAKVSGKKAGHKSSLPFIDFFTIYQTAASDLDSAALLNTKHASSLRRSRNVLSTDVTPNSNPHIDWNINSMFIDSTVDDDPEPDDVHDDCKYDVFASRQRRPFDRSTNIPGDGFIGMSKEFKSLWMKEDPAAKRTLLSSIRKSPPPDDGPTAPTGSSSLSKRVEVLFLRKGFVRNNLVRFLK
jgi:hypothetical protein